MFQASHISPRLGWGSAPAGEPTLGTPGPTGRDAHLAQERDDKVKDLPQAFDMASLIGGNVGDVTAPGHSLTSCLLQPDLDDERAGSILNRVHLTQVIQGRSYLGYVPAVRFLECSRISAATNVSVTYPVYHGPVRSSVCRAYARASVWREGARCGAECTTTGATGWALLALRGLSDCTL
jgi:hypothetical protein